MAESASDLHRRTIDLGVRALAQATRHKTSAEPMAYEVWYEYVAGQRDRLSDDIAVRMARGGLTDGDLRDLHAAHLSPAAASLRIDEIGAGAQTEVRTLLTFVTDAIRDLSTMNGDLRSTADRLASPGLKTDMVLRLIEAAITTTQSVCHTNAGLQDRLIQSETSISALQHSLEEARGEAQTDAMTSLMNRRAFDGRYADRVEDVNAGNGLLCLIMLDIDHFKSFNDTHGHPVGDQVIRAVAAAIRDRVGPADLAARYGGEEFAVASIGRSLPDAIKLAESIRRSIEELDLAIPGAKRTRARITVSVGVASRRPGDTAAALLSRADDCLYAAKRAGRNRVNTDALTYVEQAEVEERMAARTRLFPTFHRLGETLLRAVRSCLGMGVRRKRPA